MGHRANFVLIHDAEGAAYHDQWAALGSTYAFAGGPADATAAAEAAEPTTELLDWAFAEAGFLLDFDEYVAIVFGQPEPTSSRTSVPRSSLRSTTWTPRSNGARLSS